MGIAVAAAGSLLGGIVGKAIMGTPAPIGPDTSVPGISKATIQKANKADPGLSIAQVDPTHSINYFKQAAESYNTQALQGVNYYTNAIQQAIDSVNTTVNKSNLGLNQIVAQGTPASKEYMRMLGLNPPSDLSTSGFFDQVKNMGYGDIAAQMQAAENIADPSQRALSRQTIMNNILTRSQTLDDSINQSTYQTARDAYLEANPASAPMSVRDWEMKYSAGTPVDTKGRTAAQQSGVEPLRVDQMAPQTQTAYNNYLAGLDSQRQTQANNAGQQAILAAAASQRQQGQQLADQYASQYSSDLDQGYSGAAINDKLQNTPGYQFQARQGNQAIARGAAASGMLGAGNTGAALSEFNQNLASNTYQGFLNNLSPLMQSGNTALSQIANNYMAQGSSLAQLYGNLGSGLLSAYQNIGQAYNNAYTNAGQTSFNADVFNANAQNQAIAAKNKQNQEAAQNAAQNQLSAGYLNLANNQFNYQQQQSQNYGAGFAFNNNGGGGSSYGAGSGWPSYNPGTMAWYTV